ncbi:MAG TPA: PaaI family thioesterase [Bradyrhizobium sp.]|nr:PaaI family thioesterase [Bradyrhizobium sp.]
MREEAQAMFDKALADERHEFGSFFLSRFLGFHISYQNDSCIVSFEIKQPMYNPQGSLHGGVLATALDISMGHLLHHYVGAGSTLEMKVQYFSPIRSGLLRCESGFLKRGRSIFFLQSHAYDGAGEAVAHATSTWKLLKK